MNHFDDISIDIETLGKRFDAPVISIAAVPFEWTTGKISKSVFYEEIDVDSSIKAGHVDGSTLSWWMQQDEKAKRVFARGEHKVPLASALDRLAVFMRQFQGARVWGNGATFDITILEYAYVHGGVGLSCPWASEFWLIRDMRTLVDEASFDKSQWPFPKTGVAHNALDDATYQAGVIAAAKQKIARALGTMPAAMNMTVDPKAQAKASYPIVPDEEEL